MKNKSAAVSEKEKEQKLKALRRDLEEKLEEQLPEELLEPKIRVEVEKVDVNEKLEPAKAKRVIEALLFASSKPMTVQEIKKVMRSASAREIQDVIEELRQEYQESGRSFEILEVAGGFEIATRKEYAPWICRADMQKKAKQATQSALETLAILAYKQPLTRAEIEELRGVDVSGVVANLMERGFIKIVGKKEIPGRPFLYATTEKFLEHFGLNSLKDLPNIEEIRQLVEKSVKREELLGTQKLVENQPEPSSESGAEASASETAQAGEDAVNQAAAAESSIGEEQQDELDAEIEKALLAEEDFEEELIVDGEPGEQTDEAAEDR
ncbi:MAG: SMC-Scp complex subunit ScpB [Candidatus Omnitrophica bacterium]|nr:SMC-Scp complex subunit ScpB [Candidatus Omnitrophota bacterium]